MPLLQAPSGFARAGALRVTDLRAAEGQEVHLENPNPGSPVYQPRCPCQALQSSLLGSSSGRYGCGHTVD
jgi:hypothetical protein